MTRGSRGARRHKSRPKMAPPPGRSNHPLQWTGGTAGGLHVIDSVAAHWWFPRPPLNAGRSALAAERTC
jgi:hypothetical protein